MGRWAGRPDTPQQLLMGGGLTALKVVPADWDEHPLNWLAWRQERRKQLPGARRAWVLEQARVVVVVCATSFLLPQQHNALVPAMVPEQAGSQADGVIVQLHAGGVFADDLSIHHC